MSNGRNTTEAGTVMPSDRSGATPRKVDLAVAGDAMIQDAWDRESLYDLSAIASEALVQLRIARIAASETAPADRTDAIRNGQVPAVAAMAWEVLAAEAA